MNKLMKSSKDLLKLKKNTQQILQNSEIYKTSMKTKKNSFSIQSDIKRDKLKNLQLLLTFLCLEISQI